MLQNLFLLYCKVRNITIRHLKYVVYFMWINMNKS